jgi:hypothetical protein
MVTDVGAAPPAGVVTRSTVLAGPGPAREGGSTGWTCPSSTLRPSCCAARSGATARLVQQGSRVCRVQALAEHAASGLSDIFSVASPGLGRPGFRSCSGDGGDRVLPFVGGSQGETVRN